MLYLSPFRPRLVSPCSLEVSVPPYCSAVETGRLLIDVAASAPAAQRSLTSSLGTYSLPSHISRHWMVYTVSGVSLASVCVALVRSESELGSLLRRSVRCQLRRTCPHG